MFNMVRCHTLGIVCPKSVNQRLWKPTECQQESLVLGAMNRKRLYSVRTEQRWDNVAVEQPSQSRHGWGSSLSAPERQLQCYNSSCGNAVSIERGSALWWGRRKAGLYLEKCPAPDPGWSMLMQIGTPDPQFDWYKKQCLDWSGGATLIDRCRC